MNQKQLKKLWLQEERNAQIKGWDFSYLAGRYSEGTTPWDYREILLNYLNPMDKLLDIDTGGGEFLLKLPHPFNQISATEGYPPNVALCKKTLLPLGIDFKPATDHANLPFANEEFDLIINRHGAYDIKELYRILKPNGFFITQQVGEQNDRDLVGLLLPDTPSSFHGMNLAEQAKQFRHNGFSLLQEYESFSSIDFFDVGALVWFAKIIPWEFRGFSVSHCWPQLLRAQKLIEKNGKVRGRTHRYLIVAQKK